MPQRLVLSLGAVLAFAVAATPVLASKVNKPAHLLSVPSVQETVTPPEVETPEVETPEVEAPEVDEAPPVLSGDQLFATTLPLTSAVMAEKFPPQRDEIVSQLDADPGADDTARQRLLVTSLATVAISFELNIPNAPDAANKAVLDRQVEYIGALLDGEGAEVCAPAVFDGTSVLVDLGLYAKYAPFIDATMAAYFEAVRLALDEPAGLGFATDEDSAIVINQMDVQGDTDLMNHFSVMTRESPENCPAVLALVEALNAIDGDPGIRVRALQARGASRL